MTEPYPRKPAYLNVRVEVELRRKLKELADAQGLTLPVYLRKHYRALAETGIIEPHLEKPFPHTTTYLPPPFTPSPPIADALTEKTRKFLEQCEKTLTSLLGTAIASGKITFMEAVTIKDMYKIGMQEMLK